MFARKFLDFENFDFCMKYLEIRYFSYFLQYGPLVLSGPEIDKRLCFAVIFDWGSLDALIVVRSNLFLFFDIFQYFESFGSLLQVISSRLENT